MHLTESHLNNALLQRLQGAFMDQQAVTSQNRVVLTYETLYELLRREKNREELQALDASFFADLVAYLREKDILYQDSSRKTDVFSMAERQRLHTELHNIHRLVKELYERREKKIIDMALNRSRTNANIVDTTNLLAEERALFDQFVNVLDLFRNSVLASILQLREPMLTPKQAFGTPTQTAEPIPNLQPASAQKQVRFLQSVPQVVGTEMETYGPFNPNDTASLPAEIADIWIEQGMAVENRT